MKAIAIVSVVSVRADKFDKAEIVTQLLFGESMDIIKEAGNWTKIKMHYDGYEGWVDSKQISLISDEDLLFFGDQLAERTKDYNFLKHNLSSLKLTYINLIGELILRKIDTQVPLFILELEKLLFPYDMLEIMLLKFLKLVNGYLKSKNSKKEIKQFIESLRVVGDSQLINILEVKLDQFGIHIN